MATLMEYVGALHIFLGPYRGNPISLYLSRNGNICRIGPKVYPWKEVVGEGDTPNRAAADFEEKWKARGLSPDMYTGPSWEGGIKPEKPAPPKPAAAPKPPQKRPLPPEPNPAPPRRPQPPPRPLPLQPNPAPPRKPQPLPRPLPNQSPPARSQPEFVVVRVQCWVNH